MVENITKHRVHCSYRVIIGPLSKVTPLPSRSTQDLHPDLYTTTRLRHNSVTATPRQNPSSYWVHNYDQNTTTPSHFAQLTNASTSPVLRNTDPTTASSSSTCDQVEQPGINHQNSPDNNTALTIAEQQPTNSGDMDPPSTQTSFDINKVIKEDALLCMVLISSLNEKLPTRYKKRNADVYKRQGNWRQLETVLTPSALACYDSTALSWPHRTLEHWIPLDDQKDTNLSLYLFSSLDFTFCVQYTSAHSNQPLTLIFRARSFGLCQEWYSSLYKLFPTGSKKPLPQQCDIYLPTLDLRVHLPLLDDYQFITMKHVKRTVVDLLQVDPNWLAMLEKEHSELLLCWTRKGSAEWVDKSSPSNLLFCPQLIEKSHQLELRPAQHTPHTITTDDNMSIEDPPPCEGYLTMMTDFEGRRLKSWAPRCFYFASFGCFLFVIPSDKAIVPDTKNFANKATFDSNATGLRSFFVERVENDPSVNLATPFADQSQTEQRDEIDRRTRLVADAVGYIDLTQVEYVKPSNRSSSFACHDPVSRSIDSDDETTPISAGFHGDSPSSPLLQRRHDGGIGSTEYEQPYIEMVMKNGISMRLQSHSHDTCDLWISCLSALILYSNAQLEAIRDIHATLDSMVKEGSDEASVNGSLSPRTDHIDTRLWSLCLYNRCHEVAKSGILYIQSKDVFSQKQFILTMDGRLHYFNIYKRSGDDGKPIRTGLHERKGVLELNGAYVYSGQVSALDSKRPLTLDRPPRLFSDGIASHDSTDECLFTLWIPKRRRVFSSQRQSLIVYGPHQRFPSKGTRCLFLAPDRHEMEHWMWTISVVQDQLLRRL